MPPVGKYEDPYRPTIRPGRTRWGRALRNLARIGVNMNDAVKAYLDWVNHDTDELPPRPPKPERDDSED